MMEKPTPSKRVELYLAICREHGLIESGLEGRYAADTRIDEHRENGCDERVVRMTHGRWEELKKVGALNRKIAEGTNYATSGP